MALSMCATFSSCEKDDGSAGIEVRMRNQGDIIEMLRVDSAYYYAPYVNSYGYQVGGYWERSWVELAITSSNNFYLSGSRCDCDIVCVGSVGGLGRINNIPSSGWTNQVAVQPGQGYIIRSKNPNGNNGANYYNQWYKYARVYVVDWIEGASSGGILGAIIRYQDNWKED